MSFFCFSNINSLRLKTLTVRAILPLYLTEISLTYTEQLNGWEQYFHWTVARSHAETNNHVCGSGNILIEKRAVLMGSTADAIATIDSQPTKKTLLYYFQARLNSS